MNFHRLLRSSQPFLQCHGYLQNSDNRLPLPPPVSMKSSQQSQDIVLIQRAQEGDIEAFSQLVTNYPPKVFAMVYGIVRNEDDALDLAQEIFFKLWQSIHRFEGRSSFSTWLHAISMNAAICFLRAKGVRKEVKLDDAIPSPHPNPGAICHRTEVRERVAVAIGQLSPNHRAVIELKELHGLQYHEIAETLNLSIGTVMSRLFYARKRLQSLLAAVYQPCQKEQNRRVFLP